MYVCICVYVLFVPDIISVKQCPLEKDCKYIYIYIYKYIHQIFPSNPSHAYTYTITSWNHNQNI